MSNPDVEPERPPWINHFFAVVPNAKGEAILMYPSPDGWRLPYARGEGLWLATTARVAALLAAAGGLDFEFTILRCAALEINEQERWDRILFVVEPAAPLLDAPDGGQWVACAALQELALANPEQRAALLAYLAEHESGCDFTHTIDARRSPWARSGWFATAAAWVEAAITELGYTQSGPVEQLRNWSISSLLVAPTSAGRVFFKAAAALPLFVNEPALTQTLSELFPTHIPTPLKIDREQRWMLMEDFGAHSWDDEATDFGPIFVAYGKLQRASAEHLDALVAAGCIDRGLDRLASQVDALIADPTTRAALTPAEHAKLVALAPALKARCAEVAGYALPATLLHGDLHLGNITLRDRDYIFFDWTDAAIGFPFLDFFHLYFEFEQNDERTRWRDAYLEVWAEVESPARLREVWELAKPLCALHHAISYLTIVNHVEALARQELWHGLPNNLHRLLGCFRDEAGDSSPRSMTV